jgi:GTP-binding protein
MTLKLAIVGRPNVGKSTLFNRLAGRKLAIVDDQPGVTRDRRFGTGRIGDLDLELIDTAGFEDLTDDSLEARMRVQTELAIDDADVALFVIDSREGVTPIDEVFAEILRRRDKPVVLAANKAEGRAGESGILEAFGLGLGEPVPISAEHGEGMADLYAALIAVAPDQSDHDDADGDKAVKIAIVGRPNAGKSTLVNKLIGEDRMLTGPEAGITRDAIPVDWTWDDKAVRLVDTAGLRRKAKVQEKLEKLSTHDSIRAITFAEIVILVMDATHPFEIQDLQIADLVEREGRGLVFVLAKWDLVEDQQATLAHIVDEAQRQLPQVRGAPIIALSAETGRGLEKLMPAVFHRAPSAAGGERAADQAQVHGPDQVAAADLRAVRQPRRPAAGKLSPLPGQLDPRELRAAWRADPHHREIEQEPLRRGRGEVRPGPGAGAVRRGAAEDGAQGQDPDRRGRQGQGGRGGQAQAVRQGQAPGPQGQGRKPAREGSEAPAARN